jgi:hypothetical protein
MTAPSPLTGTDLIDCARANAKQGITVAAQLSGYGQDLDRFVDQLRQACEEIGVQYHDFQDLLASTPQRGQEAGIEIAPESLNQL